MQRRAQDYIATLDQKYSDQRVEFGVTDEVAALEQMTPARLAKLGAAEVKTLDDLGDLAGDELIEILGELAPDADVANEIIMAARAHWFDDEDAPEAAANSEGGDETAGAADAEETASE